MNRFPLDESIFTFIDKVTIYSTEHVIVKDNKNGFRHFDVIDGIYEQPPKDLDLSKNFCRTLTYIRKQYLLQLLMTFLNNHQLKDMDDINAVIRNFEDYMRDLEVKNLLYSPFLSNNEFERQMLKLLNNINYYLELSIKTKPQNNNSTVTLNDDCLDIFYKTDYSQNDKTTVVANDEL